MARIKSKHSKTEVALRKALWHFGYRYRCHVKGIAGKPDLVFAHWKVAIFVDGDFWHGHNWHERKYKIKTNAGFWIPKIERNMQRDREVTAALEAKGWQVVRVWEHEIKREFGATVMRIVRVLEAASGNDVFL